MKTIALTRGQEAIVDDRDFAWISELHWHAKRARVDSDMYYATMKVRRDGKQDDVFMHRLIWQAHNGVIPAGQVIHHRNANKLDNRICNLQIISEQANLLERKYGR